MMTHLLPIAGKLPTKTLIARQLPTNYAHTHREANDQSGVQNETLKRVARSTKHILYFVQFSFAGFEVN